MMLPLFVILLMIRSSGEAPRPEQDTRQALANVRRIFVEMLNGGESAVQLHDLLVSSLQESKLFILTEEPARADAIMKGSGEATIFTDTFSSSESLNEHSQSSSSARTGNSISKTISGAVGFGENESTHRQERKHEAIATVRLVNREGDVIWSTTQESLGAKFRGAGADVADKVTKRLAADYRKAKAVEGH